MVLCFTADLLFFRLYSSLFSTRDLRAYGPIAALC